MPASSLFRHAATARVLRWAAAWVLLLALPGRGTAQSQTTSAIRGTVLGAEGTPVAEATVRVRHTGTGAERLAATNAQGRFLVLLLQPGGPYEVVVAQLGFAEGRETGIQLQVGETYDLRMVLQARPIEVEGVSVSVERNEIFNPGQVGPATLLSEEVVASVPLLSRDIMELTILSPLVRTTEQGGFSVGGQNDRYNAILVDGLVNQDPFGLTSTGIPGGQAGARLLPLDAVAQYEVQVAPFDARLSGFAGGVMNAVTRSGTNEWTFRASGVGRHEALMGDLTLPTGPTEASGVQRGLVAFSAGGPLVRDQTHLFVAAEVERRSRLPSGYNVGRDAAELVGITPEAMAAFQEHFTADHGLDPGIAEAYPLDQDLVNLFGRVDRQLGPKHRLTVRDIFARATNDESPNRAAFEPYELSSNAVFRTSTTNTLSAQLFTDLGNQSGHEVDLTIQRTTDRTNPASDFPQVEATLLSPDASLTANRPLRVGAQFYAQRNDLEQTRIRLSNALTLGRGTSTYTLGVSAGWVGVRHEYLPGAQGAYTFATWTDLVNNAPLWYQRAALAEGVSPEISFGVVEAGAFVQNQLELDNGLTVRYGARADLPVV
ncbi:MAG: carboxypeptidase regulatory-like domain-containing protein, partial [Gemmatimonadota bacterium]